MWSVMRVAVAAVAGREHGYVGGGVRGWLQLGDLQLPAGF
jgi:hypothetical protein